MSMREVVQALEHVLAPPADESGLDGSDWIRILSFFRHSDLEAGCTVHQVVSALASDGANTTLHQVRSVVESLVVEGYLYTTIDDDHFRAT